MLQTSSNTHSLCLDLSRLPEGWWDSIGPTPSSDASGMSGICHDIIGTDGLAFAPDVQEVGLKDRSNQSGLTTFPPGRQALDVQC